MKSIPKILGAGFVLCNLLSCSKSTEVETNKQEDSKTRAMFINVSKDFNLNLNIIEDNNLVKSDAHVAAGTLAQRINFNCRH